MKWLANKSQKKDTHIFFFYAGHGLPKISLFNCFSERSVEQIIPQNYWKFGGAISNQELYDSLVSKLGNDCIMVSIFDCCHSGKILNLPYVYNSKLNTWKKNTKHNKKKKPTIICLSASKDNQLAYENIKNQSGGAFTNLVIELLNGKKRFLLLGRDDYSIEEIIIQAKSKLKPYQTPQLTTNKPKIGKEKINNFI